MFELIGEVQQLSVGALQSNLANKTISITGRSLESQMLCMPLHSVLSSSITV